MSLARLFILLLSASLVACSGGGGGGGGGSGTTTGPSPTVTDTTAPQVVSVTPVNGATKVGLDSKITVVFSEPVVAVSAQAGLHVTGPGGWVPGIAAYDSASNSVTFTPNSPLNEYTQYQVTVSNILDNAGNINTLAYSGNFTTHDLTPPATTASEVAGIYNHVLSVSLSCTDTNGSGCAATYYSVDGSTPSLVYSGPLTIGEGVTTLKFFSVDNDGETETEQAIQYTVDLTPPTVTSISPSGAATNVSTDASMQVTFSEPVDAGTLVDGSITLNNGMGGKIAYNPSTNTATFVPSALLKCNTMYTGTVTGVADLATNVMSGSYTWTFTTTADCSAPVTTASPDGGVIRGTSVGVTLTCNDTASTPSTGCARIAYTTDGTIPSFKPLNGTVISGNIVGPITLATGETTLKFSAQDYAGNTEVVRSKQFAVSDNGYLYVADEIGLSRGIGPVPDSFITTIGGIGTGKVFRDVTNGRLYSVTASKLYASDDEGMSWSMVCCSGINIKDVYAKGDQIYLGTNNGLLVSRDGLRTYTFRTTADGLDSDGVNQVEVFDNLVYVRTAANSIAISDNYGSTFIKHTFGTGGANSIFVDGANVYVGGSNGLYISNDRGSTYSSPKTTADGLGSNTVNDIYTIGNQIYLATNGGISTSVDGGLSFKNTTVTGGSPQSVYANALYVYASAYNSYTSLGGVSIAAVSSTGNLIFSSPKNQANGLRDNDVNEMTSGPNGEIYFGTTGGLSVSYDNGASFINNGLGGGLIRDVYASGNQVYVATQYGFSISNDGGYHYVTRTKHDGIGENSTTKVITHAGNIYVGTWSGLSISADGLTFSNKTISDGIGITNPGILDLSSDGTYLYIVTQDGLAKPSSKGPTPYVTLTTANGLTSNQLMGVHVYNGIVYVATYDGGLDISTDNGATWTQKTTSDGIMGTYLSDVFAIGNYVHLAGYDSMSISANGGISFTANAAFTALSSGASHVTGYSNYVYMAEFSDLYISSDNGSSFVTRNNSNGLSSNGTIWGLSYAP